MELNEPRELGARAAEVLALAAEVAAADGVEALSEQTVLDVRSPVRTVRHVLAEAGGELLGYAQVQPGDPASAELAVRPSRRRAGVGRALLDAVRVEPVAVWAHGDLPAARALARAAGMEAVRELLRMARPLTAVRDEAASDAAADAADADDHDDAVADGPPRPAGPAPEGIVVEAFRPGRDEEDWVRLNARAFAAHPEQGRMTVADLRAREAEGWFDPTVLWLARPGPGAPAVASMWVKVVPGEDAGEIYALAVDPDAQGRGLGGHLTRLALAEMAARGLRTATLYVEGDNLAARRTYEKEGFVCAATDVQYR
jgi:mycothiol synthase